MKALSRPLLGPQLRLPHKRDLAVVESDQKKRLQCTDLLALLFTTTRGAADQDNHHYLLRALACWLAVLHTAALPSIAALAFSAVHVLLTSGFAAEAGVRVAIVLSYGAWALIFSLGATTASALQGLLRP